LVEYDTVRRRIDVRVRATTSRADFTKRTMTLDSLKLLLVRFPAYTCPLTLVKQTVAVILLIAGRVGSHVGTQVICTRQVPANDASTSVAKPPKAANVAIWGFPIALSVSANRPQTQTIARIARIAAGTDQSGTATSAGANTTCQTVRARGPEVLASKLPSPP